MIEQYPQQINRMSNGAAVVENNIAVPQKLNIEL
jgi:hypothetical protein